MKISHFKKKKYYSPVLFTIKKTKNKVKIRGKNLSGKNAYFPIFEQKKIFFRAERKRSRALLFTIHASNLYIIWVWWGCPSISIQIKPLIFIVCNPRKVVAGFNPWKIIANFTQGSNPPMILDVPDCIQIIFPAWFSIHVCCSLIISI